jgi:predicted nucleic acid-binding protein
MIVLDTTVLVYAVGADHSLRRPCRDLVEAIAERRIEATTTVEVIQEFVHVRGRRPLPRVTERMPWSRPTVPSPPLPRSAT